METTFSLSSAKMNFLKGILTAMLLTVLTLTTNAQQWSSMGSLDWGNSLCVYNNELYAGTRTGCFKWNGSSWAAFGGGVTGEVDAMVVYNGNLIIGGKFIDVAGLGTPYLAKWDGSSWNDLGGTTNSYVQALAVYGTKLIIGGYFIQCENLPTNYIVQYDGSNFTTMGSGMGGSQGQVMALTTYNNKLIAGGFFSTAGGVTVNHLAQWDGAAWSPIGSGSNSIVYALNNANGKLYAGGLFNSVGGVSAQGIASYDGSSWSALGSGCGSGMYPYVFSITPFGTDIYAAGLYTVAGGQTVNGIARWDGASWHPLGSGFYSGGGNVYGAYASCVYNNNLICNGIFSSAGGVGCGNVAQWDGLTLTGVNNNNTGTPNGFSLSQNYPNPFNPSTTIKFSISKQENVKLTVVNELGQQVDELINKQYAPGTYEIKWEASKHSSGVYFYTISTPSFSETKKMILTK